MQQDEAALLVGAASHALDIMCGTCERANAKKLNAMFEEERQGQSLSMASLGKVWAKVRRALFGRTAAQKRAAAEELAAMRDAHLAGPGMCTMRYIKRERVGMTQEMGTGGC